MNTRKKLCAIKGISEAKMEKIKEAAAKLCGVGLILLHKKLFFFGLEFNRIE